MAFRETKPASCFCRGNFTPRPRSIAPTPPSGRGGRDIPGDFSIPGDPGETAPGIPSHVRILLTLGAMKYLTKSSSTLSTQTRPNRNGQAREPGEECEPQPPRSHDGVRLGAAKRGLDRDIQAIHAGSQTQSSALGLPSSPPRAQIWVGP